LVEKHEKYRYLNHKKFEVKRKTHKVEKRMGLFLSSYFLPKKLLNNVDKKKVLGVKNNN